MFSGKNQSNLHHVVIEVIKTDTPNRNIMVMIHGIFTEFELAKTAIKKIGETELVNATFKESSVLGKSIEDPNGPNHLVYVQTFSTLNEIIW